MAGECVIVVVGFSAGFRSGVVIVSERTSKGIVSKTFRPDSAAVHVVSYSSTRKSQGRAIRWM